MSEIRSQATPARDELAELIASRRGVTAKLNDIDRMMADRILDAGWSKPRTVNSAADLDALPMFTVIRSEQSRSNPRRCGRTIQPTPVELRSVRRSG